MSHIHKVIDTDTHYKIDGITRTVTNIDETKRMLVQNDHNSERFTFEIPRFVDGHDFLECNVVQVHYINVDAAAENKSEGIYTVDDLHVKGESEEDKNIVVLSWLIDGNATKYVGTLNFAIRFSCVTGEVVDYAWHTTPFEGILIKDGINNSEIVIKPYEDILAIWEGRFKSIEDKEKYSVQGRSAKYSFTKPGWKRILNIIRATNGTIHLGLSQSFPRYMCQALGINFTGFVKYKEDTSVDKKPVIYQLYNNIFGEDDALKGPGKITAVRIGYPKQGTDFPNSDGAVKDYSNTPVNCYVDILVDFNPNTLGNNKTISFNMNYSGFANNHNCKEITEETEASNTGIYGEELEYYTMSLKEDVDLYLPDGVIQAKDMRIGDDDVWSAKVIADKLCPQFVVDSDGFSYASCEPVESYPLEVIQETGLNNSYYTLTQTGKNLLNTNLLENSKTLKGVTFIRNADGTISVNGKATAATVLQIANLTLQRGTYTFSFGFSGNSNVYGQIFGPDDDKIATLVGSSRASQTFRLNMYTDVVIRIYFTGECNALIKPQLELGEVATEYEQYHEKKYELDIYNLKNIDSFNYNWKTGVLVTQNGTTHQLNPQKIIAFPGVNVFNVTEYEESTTIQIKGRSNPISLFEKLTNAVIALGGKV